MNHATFEVKLLFNGVAQCDLSYSIAAAWVTTARRSSDGNFA
jgi:hypothetical protein